MDIVSVDHETLPKIDVVINSAASIIEQHPDVNILELSKIQQSISNGIVIVTNGHHEIHAIDRDGTCYSLIPPEVIVTDSTGAGDSFRAGIIFGQLKGWPLTQSLKWSASVGALQVQRDISQEQFPSIDEIKDMASHIVVKRMS